METKEYSRLLELKSLINDKRASTIEKKEYMEILYRNGNITKQQYDSFITNQNSDEIINAALTIGGVILATWLISRILD